METPASIQAVGVASDLCSVVAAAATDDDDDDGDDMQ
jgi:hypothetical protein